MGIILTTKRRNWSGFRRWPRPQRTGRQWRNSPPSWPAGTPRLREFEQRTPVRRIRPKPIISEIFEERIGSAK